MDVIFNSQRKAVVDDVIHVRNIQTSCSHIGSDQNRNATLLELFQRRCPVVLLFVTMNSHHCITTALDHPLNPSCFFLVENKDNDTVLFLLVIIFTKHFPQAGRFIVLIHHFDDLMDAFVGSQLVVVTDSHLDRASDKVHAELTNRVGPGGREEQSLTRAQRLLHDGTHVRLKTQVQHAIGFVQHQIAHFVELHGLVPAQAQQTARGGHQDVYAGAQLSHLRTAGHTTVHQRATHPTAAICLLADLMDLRGELSSGSQHQHQRLGLTALVRMRATLQNHTQRRHQEGQRLSRAGLGDADHIVSAERQRPALALNRGRGRKVLY
mmetsp:Transcript_5539/g.14003  ORF Transcript_5539/g.14003 Transcript_5539/m.14003 type:complete len:323 (+) Transcript_5539:2153-3121(+)